MGCPTVVCHTQRAVLLWSALGALHLTQVQAARFIPAVILNPRGLKNTPLPELHPRYSDAVGLGYTFGLSTGPSVYLSFPCWDIHFSFLPSEMSSWRAGRSFQYYIPGTRPSLHGLLRHLSSFEKESKESQRSEAGCATGCWRALGRQVIGMVKVRGVRQQLKSPQILPKPLTAVHCAAGAKWRPQGETDQGTVLSE